MSKKIVLLSLIFIVLVVVIISIENTPRAISMSASLTCPGNLFNDGTACINKNYCKCTSSYGFAGGTPDAPTCPQGCEALAGNAQNLKIIACGLAGGAPECPTACETTSYQTTSAANSCITCKQGVICSEKKTNGYVEQANQHPDLE